MGEQSGLIHYRCTAPDHQSGRDGAAPDTLTVHEGRWAYCPMNARADGHVWKDTGGQPISELRRSAPMIDLDVSAPAATVAAQATAPKRARARTTRS